LASIQDIDLRIDEWDSMICVSNREINSRARCLRRGDPFSRCFLLHEEDFAAIEARVLAGV
jgi:hypothetical protein